MLLGGRGGEGRRIVESFEILIKEVVDCNTIFSWLGGNLIKLN